MCYLDSNNNLLSNDKTVYKIIMCEKTVNMINIDYINQIS